MQKRREVWWIPMMIAGLCPLHWCTIVIIHGCGRWPWLRLKTWWRIFQAILILLFMMPPILLGRYGGHWIHPFCTHSLYPLPPLFPLPQRRKWLLESLQASGLATKSVALACVCSRNPLITCRCLPMLDSFSLKAFVLMTISLALTSAKRN